MCLEADECWPGLLECRGISLLVPILFPPVSFFMQLLDRGHHPYISTGFGEKHFYSPYIYQYIYSHSLYREGPRVYMRRADRRMIIKLRGGTAALQNATVGKWKMWIID